MKGYVEYIKSTMEIIIYYYFILFVPCLSTLKGILKEV